MSELLDGLTAVVQYRQKDGMDTWKSMAAFDIESMAEKYAKDCSGDNIPWEYRVVTIPPKADQP